MGHYCNLPFVLVINYQREKRKVFSQEQSTRFQLQRHRFGVVDPNGSLTVAGISERSPEPSPNPNSNYTNNSNSILSSTPVWPTIDGPLGLSEEESLSYARRFYKFGYALLLFLGLSIASTSGLFSVTLAPSLAFAPMLCHQPLGFHYFVFMGIDLAIGGEHLFGSTWDQLVMYNVADRLVPFVAMAAMNSSVLACNYAISGSGLNAKLPSVPSVASPVLPGGHKLPVIRAQQQGKVSGPKNQVAMKEEELLCSTLFTTAAASSANAGSLNYLEKSKANKELNDKKRLATSGANFARAYTVQFGTCKFPENFTGCQDLQNKRFRLITIIFEHIYIVGFVDAESPFISEDLAWSVRNGRTNTSAVPMFSGMVKTSQCNFLNFLCIVVLFSETP
ncbi:hypothetical protein CXB51_004751 [Gossypium anomalum]|uniref:Uncharacterized protein n=1 Tax=Gossypium anomalum TaxID=47600 RepID=A0A8J5ZJD1_9ROSI|nr:hypothetical protein CXB51_004751 [Gossypium anomalum]